MVWVYDKRPTNGSAFVYWGMIPVDSQSKEAKILIEYTQGVLTALKLDNGPTHGEVMMKDDVPCLVEMNCRSHGWDGAWVPLANMLCGYAQPALALDSHVNPAKFKQIPDVMPSPFKASGQAVMLVSYFAGTVKSAPGYEKMKKLPSFLALQTGYEKGSKVELTVDLFTAVGVLMLANQDNRQLDTDLVAVRRMEKEGIFEFDEEIDPAMYQPGIASDLSMHPVVSCPPDGMNQTCLTNPPGSSNAFIVKPSNVAKLAAQFFAHSCPEVSTLLDASIREKIRKLEEADDRLVKKARTA
jgi:hypothetical protein